MSDQPETPLLDDVIVPSDIKGLSDRFMKRFREASVPWRITRSKEWKLLRAML